MGVDASAVARVLGITTEYKDLRAGEIQFLPQRIVVLGQGATASTYDTDKYQITSAAQAGTRYGWGSPIHLAAMQLFPTNGDGVGSIPVTVYPLEDHASGAASEGDITPSGTLTEDASYQIVIGGVASELFTLEAGALATAANLHSALRVMGEAVQNVLEMPVIASWTYGAVTAAALAGGTGNGTCTSLSVTGEPLPGVYELALNTVVAHGGVWTLTDPNGTVIADDITMTGGTGAATAFDEGGIAFTLTDGTTDFGAGAYFLITVAATKLDFTSKWEGESANGITIQVEDAGVGASFAITQPTGGLNNPSIDDALAQVGDVWETLVLNCMNPDDSDTLDTLQEFGEGRWGTLTKKPLICFTGCTDADVADATANTSGRTDDRVNCQLVAPGSPNLPCVVAARQLARIAKIANDNPPTDYAGQTAASLTPGDDSEQWDYATRDQAVKAGSSTIEIKDGVVNLSDTVTPYAPEGESPPAFRYVVDIVKLQNIIYNLELIFASDDWIGKPLVPDAQRVANPNARKPRAAKAAVNSMIDSLGEQAIISDPKTAKAATTAAINSTNPKRLDVGVTVQLSGNTNIIDVGLNFGFLFGSA
jgi:phage tail sheath gpL-like